MAIIGHVVIQAVEVPTARSEIGHVVVQIAELVFVPSTIAHLVVQVVGIPFVGGIYKVVPGKINDTLYIDGTTTEDVKIPDPLAITFLAGDDNG